MAWPAKLLGNLAGAIEAVDVTLDQMAPNSPFLTALGQSADPKVAYTLLVGNTSIIAHAAGDRVLQALLARLTPQRVLHAVTALAFLDKPNDIAVGMTSAKAVAVPQSAAQHSIDPAAESNQPRALPKPCPCCGGRMVIIETFARGCQPKYALKRGREASDERVVDSLYKNALGGNVTAQIFWLKNRRPDQWRDVQHLDQAVGHYILSDEAYD